MILHWGSLKLTSKLGHTNPQVANTNPKLANQPPPSLCSCFLWIFSSFLFPLESLALCFQKESKQSTKTRKKSLHYPFIPQKSISQIQKDTCKSSKLFYLWQRSRRTRSEIGKTNQILFFLISIPFV